jgi:hypothetical protein
MSIEVFFRSTNGFSLFFVEVSGIELVDWGFKLQLSVDYSRERGA